MPCDSVQKTSVNLDVADVDILAEALRALGYVVSQANANGVLASHHEHGELFYDAKAKKLTTRTRYGQQAQNANEIKVAYSTNVARKVASKFGWSLAETKATAGEAVHFQAKKRSF